MLTGIGQAFRGRFVEQPAVRIKASHAGIRMMVRVVLPHTPSETGDGAMTTLIPGPATQLSGEWESISFKGETDDLQKKLQEASLKLQKKLI